MRSHRSAVVLFLLLLIANAPAAHAQSGSDLFQQALRKERTEGDLPGAIELYKRISQGSDRELAARALMRMGGVYERLGREEAIEAYRRIVREFADQQDPATAARARLAAIEQAAPANAGATGLAARLVWEGQEVEIEGRPTPDGRYITFVDWFDTGDLALHEVATGKKKAITKDGDGGSVYPLQSSVSRDGQRVAYFWTPPHPRGWQPQLRVIGIDGNNERVLVENANVEIDYLEPSDWTPDGKQVLVTFWMITQTAQIALVSTVDGTVRVLRSFDWRRPTRTTLSPDGRWVVYDLQPDTLSHSRDLYVLAVDGTSEFRIEHPANDLYPIWSSQGDQLLFSSDRGGNVGLWAIRIVDGRSQGEARLVQGQMAQGFGPMGFAGDVLFYAQDTGGGDLFTASLDPTTLRASEPSRLVQEFQGYNSAAYWSADGGTLAYASRRGAARLGHAAWLVVRDTRTGRETQFTRGPLLHRSFSRPQPSPDGKYVAALSDDNRGRTGLHLVDVATGDVKKLLDWDSEAIEELGNPQWSRDGRALLYPMRLRDPRRIVLIRHDVATGVRQELLSSLQPGGGRIRLQATLSPDAERFAVAGYDRTGMYRIRVVSVASGESRDVLSTQMINLGQPRHTGLAWTPDGKYILFGKPRDQETRLVELMAVPADGGDARSTGLVVRELRHLSFAPDGRLTYTGGSSQHRQVWTLENIFARLGRSN